MKKALLSILTVVVFVATTNAQMNFGAKAGLNLSNLATSEEEFELNSKIGFNLGGYMEFSISDKFAIQPELVYSTQGAKIDESYTDSFGGVTISYTYESSVKLNYLNVPVLFKFKPSESFYLGGGPQVGLLLSAKDDWKETISDGTTTTSESGEDDYKEFMNGVDFSLVVGAGYELSSGLNFGLRYNYGLTDVFDENEGDAVTNSVIQFSVGYRFTSN